MTDSTTAAGAPCSKVAPLAGKFDEDQIAKLLLRVRGDADRGHIAVDAQPFMILGEFQHVGSW